MARPQLQTATPPKLRILNPAANAAPTAIASFMAY